MAAYTWTGATSSDWGVATNWIAVPATGTFPGAADTVVINNTVNCTAGGIARNCLTLNTTGYTGTLTIATGLTVNGNFTIGNHSILGAGGITINANSTIDVATGVTIPNLILGSTGGSTMTLARSTTVINLSKNGAFGNTTVNAATAGTLLNVANTGSIQTTGAALIMGANVTLTINGNCTVNSFSYGGNLALAAGSILTANGTITINNTAAGFNTSAGTFVPGTQSFTMLNVSASCVFNMGATNKFYNLALIGSATLASDLRITNNLISSNVAISGAFDIIADGNVTGGSITNSTTGRKLRVTGITNSSCTITSLSMSSTGSNTYKLEIDCNAFPFVMTGVTTISGGNVTIDYLATNTGPFTATSSILSLSTGALAINMNGKGNTYIWGTIRWVGTSQILSLLSEVYCNTITSIISSSSINGSILNVFGDVLSMRNTAGTGTLKFVGSSSATWNVTNANTITLATIVFAKTGAATVNIPNSFISSGSNFIYTSGAVNHTATLSLLGTTTFTNTTAIPWNNITVAPSVTININ
jgi:hypothetical protein